MNTKSAGRFAGASTAWRHGCGALEGVPRAGELARTGKFITAVRHLEALNPGLSREKAKALVYSFGYSQEFTWQDDLILTRPLRCL